MQNRIPRKIAAFARRAVPAAVVAVVAVLAAGAVAEEAGVRPRVVGIEVEGVYLFSEAEILGRIATRKGDTYSPEKIAKDLDRLASLGIIAKAVQRPAPGGVVIVFIIQAERELPEVVEVRFKGGAAAELADITQTKKGSRLTEFLLKADSDRIREHFVEKGYADAVVKADVTPVAPGQVKVKFNISKGPKFQLKKLRFVGNKAFTNKELSKMMATRVDTWITIRKFVRSDFDDDIGRLNLFYRGNGYWDAFVKLQGIATDFESGRVEAVIDIHEGQRYRISDITFQGNEAISNEELMSVVRVKPGAYYSAEQLRNDMVAMRRYYTTGGRGYASVEIVREDVPGKDPLAREITYRITEGLPTYIRRIDTRGNYKTRKKVIVREMRIEPGELYDSDKVNKSTRRLRDLQYFEPDSITIEEKPAPPPEAGAEPGAAYSDLVVNVEETTTGLLSAGAGFNTNSNLIGTIAVEQRNFDISNLPDFSRYGIGALSPSRMFIGGGQRLRLVAESGSKRNYYYFDFEEPWFFDYPVEYTLSGYLYERLLDDYSVERLGFTTGFGYRLTRELKVSLRYRAERVTVGDITPGASPDAAVRQEGTHDYRSYRLGVDFDNRDSILFPTKGIQLGAYGELGGPPAFGNVGLWKAGLSGGFFQKLWELPLETPHVLHMGAEANFSGPAFGDDEVPIYERFFAGGIGSFRGFRFQGIGPRQTVGGDTALGGSFLFLGTTEYIIPLYKEDYQLYIFNDVGTLTSTSRASAFDGLRASVGLGFRLNLPVMGRIPLTLNYAVPVEKRPGDRTQNFSFALGLFF